MVKPGQMRDKLGDSRFLPIGIGFGFRDAAKKGVTARGGAFKIRLKKCQINRHNRTTHWD